MVAGSSPARLTITKIRTISTVSLLVSVPFLYRLKVPYGAFVCIADIGHCAVGVTSLPIVQLPCLGSWSLDGVAIRGSLAKMVYRLTEEIEVPFTCLMSGEGS